VIRTAVFDATDRREYERELLRAKERAEASEAQATLLARTLQQTLIPPAPPEIPGLDVAAAYRPAGAGDEVGGDFYDVFQLGLGDWVVAIGDVQGKGVEAAVVTSLVRHTIRAAVARLPHAHEALEAVNQALVRHDATDRFCTVALLRLRAEDGSWSADLCSAGHPLPFLRRCNSVPAPLGVTGTLLGVFDPVALESTRVTLHSGDAIVLFTDGVTEARSGGNFFGEEGIVGTMNESSASADALAENLLRDVMGFQDGDPRDDIALIVVHVP
jgi:sigma-B regulation protein RsbU (phosphoserine phosphatase)